MQRVAARRHISHDRARNCAHAVTRSFHRIGHALDAWPHYTTPPSGRLYDTLARGARHARARDHPDFGPLRPISPRKHLDRASHSTFRHGTPRAAHATPQRARDATVRVSRPRRQQVPISTRARAQRTAHRSALLFVCRRAVLTLHAALRRSLITSAGANTTPRVAHSEGGCRPPPRRATACRSPAAIRPAVHALDARRPRQVGCKKRTTRSCFPAPIPREKI